MADADARSVRTHKAKVVATPDTALGECLLWDVKRQLLCFIDIEGKAYFELDPSNEDPATHMNKFDLPERPGAFAFCKDGRILFAFENGPAFYDFETKNLDRVFTFERKTESHRLNDGRVDRDGNFVVGGYSEEPDVPVFRISPDLKYETLIEGIGCTNSICFSPDGSKMYFTDSRWDPRRIDVYDYDSKKPLPTPETFISWECKPGPFGGYTSIPDGSIIDSEGGLWNANFGEPRIVRYDADGEITDIVEVAPFPTCPCLGGPDMDILYSTDCKKHALNMLDETQLEERKGCLGVIYACKVPIKGLPENLFGKADPD